jgi:protein-tyrosine phosphatase
MIDLHCHILPGIDDGAQNLTDSIDLVKLAISDGITHAICTPHIQLGRFDNNVQIISTAFDLLVAEIKSQQLSIEIAFAAEVRICPEIMLLSKKNNLPFIGRWQNTDVLLLELPHSHIPPGTDQLIKWLRKNNITPMIAHPERNRDIMADYRKLDMLYNLGCLFQVTAASLCGHFGDTAQAIATSMLKENKVTILATDAHNVKRRPPNLQAGRDAAAKIIGEIKADSLVYDIPKLISESKFIS